MFKVLIIEDEEKSRNLLEILISELNLGFVVVKKTTNGLSALEFLETNEIDVILTDIKMPLMDGIEFAEKALAKDNSRKIIIITAYDEFEYARKGLQIGVKDFLLKPFKRAEISASLLKIKQELLISQNMRSSSYEKQNLISNVKHFIKENISDSDLSLLKVAEHFYVSSSYLSRQFKKECSITFVEYLLKCRIDRACLYLENTDLRAYEIGDQIGIPDSKYFGKCFKKVTGESIQEYRRRLNSH